MEQKQAAEDTEKGGATRKQIQCPFRLLNILFSDEFAADFADLGNIATRQLLDSGKVVFVIDEEVVEKKQHGVLYFINDATTIVVTTILFFFSHCRFL